MTNEERDLITSFVQRIGGVPAASGFAAGSVPATAPALPPIDREADTLLDQLFRQYPEARYRVTQMAFVQEHALAEAQNRINRLQWEVQQAQAAAEQARQAAQQAAEQAAMRQAPPQPAASPWGAAAQPQPQPQPQQAGGRGFFGGLFGGGQPQPQYAPQPGQPQYGQQQYAPPPPPPQYAPGYQPGMFQRQGSGFLGSALTTAAGVAGGMMLGNALMNMFSPHAAAAAPLSGLGAGLPGGSPWALPDTGTANAGSSDPLPLPPEPPANPPPDNSADPWSQTQFGQDAPLQQDSSFAGAPDNALFDNSMADTSGADNAGFDSGGFDNGGGFDTGGFDDTEQV
jgi:hypothetical protein